MSVSVVNSDACSTRLLTSLTDYAGKAYDVQGVTSLNSAGHMNMSIRQPYGITAAIIPWKYAHAHRPSIA